MLRVYANVTSQRSFAFKLAQALGITTLNSAETITPTPRDRFLSLINWGSSMEQGNREDGWIREWLGNIPEAVLKMSNKLKMFNTFAANDVPCLEWTGDRTVAQGWLEGGAIVYERHKLTGHSGQGIVVKKPGGTDRIDTAPLYTKDLGGQFREYRVHVVDGQVICTQIKRKMSAESITAHGFNVPEGAERRVVRTYKNGWVFCVNNFELPETGRDVSLQAMQAVGAVSGAVDIAVRSNGEAIVIETNSAPALRSPTVLNSYAEAFNNLLDTGEV